MKLNSRLSMMYLKSIVLFMMKIGFFGKMLRQEKRLKILRASYLASVKVLRMEK